MTREQLYRCKEGQLVVSDGCARIVVTGLAKVRFVKVVCLRESGWSYPAGRMYDGVEDQFEVVNGNLELREVWRPEQIWQF